MPIVLSLPYVLSAFRVSFVRVYFSARGLLVVSFPVNVNENDRLGPSLVVSAVNDRNTVEAVFGEREAARNGRS
jgi:hypothetical protein